MWGPPTLWRAVSVRLFTTSGLIPRWGNWFSMLFACCTFFIWRLSCLALIGILCLPVRNPRNAFLVLGIFFSFPNLDAKIDNIQPSCWGPTVQKTITLMTPGSEWLCSKLALLYLSFWDQLWGNYTLYSTLLYISCFECMGEFKGDICIYTLPSNQLLGWAAAPICGHGQPECIHIYM